MAPHHTLTILGKGDKPAVVPLPPRTVDAVHTAVGDRQAGPLLLTRTGSRMTRGAAARIVTRLAVAAGIDKHLTRRSLRHTPDEQADLQATERGVDQALG